MPLHDGKVYCINHPDDQMMKNTGLNALIGVVKEKEKPVSFILGSGTIVQVFLCGKCDYIELYLAREVYNQEKKNDGSSPTNDIKAP